jgi:putative transposase
MPNHFQLVVWTTGEGDRGQWMQWLMTSHVRRHHRQYHSSGQVWHGRFKAFPIQEDDYLRTVLRYVERNPLRAGLVDKTEDWDWSSLKRSAAWLDPGPAPRGKRWIEEINRIGPDEAEAQRLRQSLDRGTPFGSEEWTNRTVATLGLESTIRAKGRPRKTPAVGSP